MKVIKTKVHTSTSYNLLDIKSVVVDEVIVFNILIKKNSDYVIIIEAGTKITKSLYSKLSHQQELYISKKDSQQQVLTYKTLSRYINFNTNNLEKIMQFLYTVNTQFFDNIFKNDNNDINIEAMNHILDSLISLVTTDSNSIQNMISFFKNYYNISHHSLHVAIYSIKLCTLLKYNDKKVRQVATAALLHDVGYTKIDDVMLKKNEKLKTDEILDVKKHTTYSVEIIKKNKILDPYIINAIGQHHERYDGSGYPKGLHQKDISDFAAIISICDVFDALTIDRPYRKEYHSFDALRMMMKDELMVNTFNQDYIKLGLKSLLAG